MRKISQATTTVNVLDPVVEDLTITVATAVVPAASEAILSV
jgi:hypothetical protein